MAQQPRSKARKSKMSGSRRGPIHVSTVLSELIAVRGLARIQSSAELNNVWQQLVGQPYAGLSRVQNLRNGVLQVAVGNAALLNELVSFRRDELLSRFQTEYPDKKIKDIKFKLKGDLGPQKLQQE